jgi:hypothetical protein
MKALNGIILITTFVLLYAFSCKQSKECENTICTQEFRTLTIRSEYANGLPYALDFIRTTDVSSNATVLQNADAETAISPTSYVYFSDALRNKIPINTTKQFKVEGFVNNQVKFSEDVLYQQIAVI